MPDSSLRTRRIVVVAPVDVAVVNALRHVPGVEAADLIGGGTLCLRYDLHDTGMDVLLPWLHARDVRLEARWWPRLRQRLLAYSDAVAREALDSDGDWDSSLRRVYARGREPRGSVRRDERRHHWRRYLARTDTRS
jgi:hypothetical protein